MTAADVRAVIVCTDCAMLAANDDDTGAADGARAAYAAGMLSWRAALGADARCVVSADEASTEFRNAGPCGVCGSMLGGDFYAADIIGGAR